MTHNAHTGRSHAWHAGDDRITETLVHIIPHILNIHKKHSVVQEDNKRILRNTMIAQCLQNIHMATT